ncbi:hypothetical protein [Nannocystis punicea]|uniref:SIR2-like domain-containing protein n=1 Tax=Nannocystis punicea TaxID=2995304 RepID=A0ABY7GZ66_9BACT|nr:hypothetical protein [Nannocystis poenicansa]WAS92192.1 hypothetical protein O0S08_38920 [Nannocystis poenicansa]
MSVVEPEEWGPEGLCEQFWDIDRKMHNRRFAFILGAGASVQSGIPAAGALVRRWLGELHRRLARGGVPLERWATPEALEIRDFSLPDAPAFYSQVFARRFRQHPDEGYADLEDIMQGKDPSFGYSVLAHILAETRHKLVITTNFDNLVGEALSIFTGTAPLVCGHESLANFVHVEPRRPVVVKIHRDLLMAPMNHAAEIAALQTAWIEPLTRVFRAYTPIVIGYGGNDGSLMGFLKGLPEDAIPGGIFWCYYGPAGPPGPEIRRLVARHRGVLVPIEGFDELMLRLSARLRIPLLDQVIESKARTRVDNYRRRVEELHARVFPPPSPALEEAEPELEARETERGESSEHVSSTSSRPGRPPAPLAGASRLHDSSEIHAEAAPSAEPVSSTRFRPAHPAAPPAGASHTPVSSDIHSEAAPSAEPASSTGSRPARPAEHSGASRTPVSSNIRSEAAPTSSTSPDPAPPAAAPPRAPRQPVASDSRAPGGPSAAPAVRSEARAGSLGAGDDPPQRQAVPANRSAAEPSPVSSAILTPPPPPPARESRSDSQPPLRGLESTRRSSPVRSDSTPVARTDGRGKIAEAPGGASREAAPTGSPSPLGASVDPAQRGPESLQAAPIPRLDDPAGRDPSAEPAADPDLSDISQLPSGSSRPAAPPEADRRSQRQDADDDADLALAPEPVVDESWAAEAEEVAAVPRSWTAGPLRRWPAAAGDLQRAMQQVAGEAAHTDPWAISMQARAEPDSGRAVALLRAGLEQFPADRTLSLDLVERLTDPPTHEAVSSAMSLVTTLLAADPDDKLALAHRTLLLAWQGQFSAAEDALRRLHRAVIGQHANNMELAGLAFLAGLLQRLQGRDDRYVLAPFQVHARGLSPLLGLPRGLIGALARRLDRASRRCYIRLAQRLAGSLSAAELARLEPRLAELPPFDLEALEHEAP